MAPRSWTPAGRQVGGAPALASMAVTWKEETIGQPVNHVAQERSPQQSWPLPLRAGVEGLGRHDCVRGGTETVIDSGERPFPVTAKRAIWPDAGPGATASGAAPSGTPTCHRSPGACRERHCHHRGARPAARALARPQGKPWAGGNPRGVSHEPVPAPRPSHLV